MIRESEVMGLIHRLAVIQHKESGGKYQFQRAVKGKIDGMWIPGAIYISFNDGSTYWRPLKDFDGFDICHVQTQ